MASGARIRPMDGIHFLCRALMRFSAYPLPPGRGWRDWLLPRSLIQDSTAAFASSVAARCVVALSVTSATMLPLPLIENRRALPCKAGGSGCPSFAAEVWSLLVEHASLHMKPHFSPEGLPGPLPSSITSVIRTNGGAAKPRHVSHTHSHHTASPQAFSPFVTPVRSATKINPTRLVSHSSHPRLPRSRYCWVGASRLSTHRRRATPLRSTTCT